MMALAILMAVLWSGSVLAQQPEFYEVPFANGQWNIGRRLDESQLRYCVDRRDPDWELAADIAGAVAGALLLEPQRYVVESDFVSDDITKVYKIMLLHCDIHMGFKLIPGGYANWITLTRPYYEAQYVFVAADPGIHALADLAPGRAIAATMGTSAHLRLVSYLIALSAEDRWPAYPMGTNDVALGSILNGTADVALVWAPSFWAKQRDEPAYADLHVINPNPLPPTTLGVGALLLADEIFLRTAIDQAIAALSEDGTIAAILEKYGCPAVVKP